MKYACLVAFAVLALAAFPSRAEDARKLTVEQTIIVTNGIAQLDGYEKIVKDGMQEKVVKVPYNFGGGLRWLLAGNIEKGRAVARQYDEARKGLIAKHWPGGNIPQEPTKDTDPRLTAEQQKQLDAFKADLRPILDAVPEVQLDRFKRDELKTGENPIPQSVLSMLLLIAD